MKTVFLLVLLLSQSIFASDFSEFNQILKDNVSVTRLKSGGIQTSFNYTNAFANKKTLALINQQKKKLSKFDIKTLNNKNAAISFWINSYNFFMVSTIIENGFMNGELNINSVKDLGSFFNPYKIFKKEVHDIGGKLVSLDYMEKTVLLGDNYLRRGWKDPRIHFAVNCASVGCPPLLDTVYNPKTLDQTLDSNLKMAFKTPRHLFTDGKVLKLTSLFKWYKKDFETSSGTIQSFIKKYVDKKTSQLIDSSKNIEFIDYDWNLNSPSNFK